MCSVGDFRVMGGYVKSLEMHFTVCLSFLILYGVMIWMRKGGANLFNKNCPLDSADFVFVKKVEENQDKKMDFGVVCLIVTMGFALNVPPW